MNWIEANLIRNDFDQLINNIDFENTDELIKILENYEVFVDDDYGGSYKSVIAYTPDKKVSRAHTPIGTLKIIDTFEKIQNQNKEYKEVIDKSIKCIDYHNRYRNDADIYQFVDIKSEILEPLKDILEQNEENSNTYLKEFNDWLKEVE